MCGACSTRHAGPRPGRASVAPGCGGREARRPWRGTAAARRPGRGTTRHRASRGRGPRPVPHPEAVAPRGTGRTGAPNELLVGSVGLSDPRTPHSPGPVAPSAPLPVPSTRRTRRTRQFRRPRRSHRTRQSHRPRRTRRTPVPSAPSAPSNPPAPVSPASSAGPLGLRGPGRSCRTPCPRPWRGGPPPPLPGAVPRARPCAGRRVRRRRTAPPALSAVRRRARCPG